MATKGIIVEQNKGDKLNGDNWDIWHHKVQYILEEQEVVKPLTTLFVEPEARTTTQHRRNLEATLKDKFGGTSTTELRRLTIKFDAYKLRGNNAMKIDVLYD
ncbi:hypothetical protein K1719_026051 [Acacia pycnantha]|nr:hypothetical protein K1719_026051 [Acacia pycnantha]